MCLWVSVLLRDRCLAILSYCSACCPRPSAVLLFCTQPLYYLLTMADQKKTRRELLETFVTQKPDDAFSRYGLAIECLNAGDTGAPHSNFRDLFLRSPAHLPPYLLFPQLP